jgi:hypothetical protein
VNDPEGPADRHASSIGPLEIAILGGLAVLVVIAFTALFSDDVRSWIAGLGEDQAPPPVVFNVVERGGFQEPVEQEVIPVDNCDQAEDTIEDVLRSRQFVPVFEFEDDLEPDEAAVLTRQLEAYYDFRQGQQVEQRFNLQLTASASSWAEYTIEWLDVWTEGVLQVNWQDGREDEFAYQGLTDVEFRTLNIREEVCP